jgi:hypothetical protein
MDIVSSAGEIRTRKHWFLRPAAQPLAYRTKSATHTGFEPAISTLTGWRPLQTGPMGRVMSLQRHHRDSNSLKMFCRHLPRHTDWCRSFESSPGRIRTVDPLFVRQVPSPLGHRTMLLFVERRPWDSNPQVFRPAVFKTASSPIRVTSVAMGQSTGDRNRTCGLLVQSQTQLPTVATPGHNAKSTAMLALTSPSSGKRIRTSIT